MGQIEESVAAPPPDTYTAEEILFAAARAARASVEDSASAADRSTRWAYKLLSQSRDRIEKLVGRLIPVVNVNRREVKQLTADKVRQEFEELAGLAMATYREALERGDLQTAVLAADKVFDRLLGKSVSTHKLEGTVKHEHEHYVSSPEVLRALDEDLLADAALMGRARGLITAGNVIDADTID